MHDLVIRGGLLFDGSGGEPRKADVAIEGGLIVAVGEVEGAGREEIEATGLIVTPGFVDVHTHYDAQVLWDTQLAPASQHGSTTVVMGNCAVGLAPCRGDQHDLLVNVMAGVEDIPEAVMVEGLKWNWETFPEYLDALEARHCDVDFAAQLAHAPLRVFVMGQRGADREPAMGTDLAQMTQLVTEALEAGAVGFSTSRSLVHRTLEGKLAPAETASEEELMAIARGIRGAGTGVIEYIADYEGLILGATADFDLMTRFAAEAGRPLSYTLTEHPRYPEHWRTMLELTEQANANGIKVTGQTAPRAVGISFGLDLSYNPFSFRKSYREVADLPLAERVAALREPGRKARILSETSEHTNASLVAMAELVSDMFLMGEIPDYEPPADESFGARAAAEGRSAEDLAYDAMLEDDGRAILYLPIANFKHRNLDAVLAMMKHPNTVISLGDGGAHYGMICDAAYPTFALTHWVRDRKGERVDLATMVHWLTRRPAEIVGLTDRGLVAPGLKADLNVIDFDNLRLHRPQVSYDLPAGARRMTQRADGYVATVKSGEITYRNGAATGKLPGRLVRGKGHKGKAAAGTADARQEALV